MIGFERRGEQLAAGAVALGVGVGGAATAEALAADQPQPQHVRTIEQAGVDQQSNLLETGASSFNAPGIGRITLTAAKAPARETGSYPDESDCTERDPDGYNVPPVYIVGGFGKSLSSEDIAIGVSNIYYEHSKDRNLSQDDSLGYNFENTEKVVTKPEPGIRASFKRKNSKIKNINMVLNENPKRREVIKFKGRDEVSNIASNTYIQPDMNVLGEKSIDLMAKKFSELKDFTYGCVKRIVNKPQAGRKKQGGKSKIFFDRSGEIKFIKTNGRNASYKTYEN